MSKLRSELESEMKLKSELCSENEVKMRATVKCEKEVKLESEVCLETKCKDRPFECCTCFMSFKFKSNLDRHKNIHSRETKFQCTDCDKRFSRMDHFKQHMTVHNGEKPYSCHLCETKFSRKQNLKSHLKRHSGFETDLGNDSLNGNNCVKVEYFNCDQCGRNFTYLKNLNCHVKQVHAREKPFVCHECNKQFPTNKVLKIHVRSHTGEKPYECLQCNKRFTRSDHLNSHSKVHRNHAERASSVASNAVNSSKQQVIWKVIWKLSMTSNHMLVIRVIRSSPTTRFWRDTCYHTLAKNHTFVVNVKNSLNVLGHCFAIQNKSTSSIESRCPFHSDRSDQKKNWNSGKIKHKAGRKSG